MNKNTIIGFILIAAIMIGYTVWMTPSQEELAKQQFVKDSIAAVQQRKIRQSQVATGCCHSKGRGNRTS